MLRGQGGVRGASWGRPEVPGRIQGPRDAEGVRGTKLGQGKQAGSEGGKLGQGEQDVGEGDQAGSEGDVILGFRVPTTSVGARG